MDGSIDPSAQFLSLTEQINDIFHNVCRLSANEAGFYYHDLGADINSKQLRKLMIELKYQLSELCIKKFNKKLVYKIIGRFNHQHTSRLHQDTADTPSILMLGYEPTVVDSSVKIGDFTRHRADNKQNAQHQHVITNNKELPTEYVTELRPFDKNHFRLVILNNSDEVGVYHGADIPTPVENTDRVINYIMMYLSDLDATEYYTEQQIEHFVDTTELDK